MSEDPELTNLKKRLKDELKKELLEEIYLDLKSEEDEGEVMKKEATNPEEQKSFETSIPIENNDSISSNKENTITMTVKSFLKISSHALKYAHTNRPKEQWIEVIGLLAGYLNGDKLMIEDVYPMGHGNAIHADIKDYKNYVRAYNDLRKNNLFICGWYHSHPSYGLWMSKEDLSTQLRYQKLWKNSIALVIDPSMINGTSFGIEIFRLNLKNRKWNKIPFIIEGVPDVKTLPALLDFIRPIIDGKALFLEYDEE